MKWWSITLMAAGTLALALGGSAWLTGRPAFLLSPWQRLWAPPPPPADQVQLLTEQITRLNAENVILRTRLDQYRRIQGEGGYPPEQVVVARGRVVARTARSGRRYCELDVGGGDGVLRDQPVVAGWTLVGLVAGIRDRRCLVQELTDSECRIPASVFDGRQLLAEGVLAGSGVAGVCQLEGIEPREDLRLLPGMPVVSAGDDGRIPAGLVIGVIATAQGGTGSEAWRITVRLPVTSQTVESLLVVDVPPVPAAPPAASAVATP
jgi:cell shape-determining protein MreC